MQQLQAVENIKIYPKYIYIYLAGILRYFNFIYAALLICDFPANCTGQFVNFIAKVQLVLQ